MYSVLCCLDLAMIVAIRMLHSWFKLSDNEVFLSARQRAFNPRGLCVQFQSYITGISGSNALFSSEEAFNLHGKGAHNLS